MSEEKVGRWSLGDIAERKADHKLFRVVGFITSPAVLFHALAPEGAGEKLEELVEVGGCLNELNGLIHYARGTE